MLSGADDKTALAPALDYAPFWRRFVASFLDGLLVWHICAPWSFGWYVSSAESIAAYATICLTRAAYDPSFHWRLSRTLGKALMRIELRTVAGDRIGWRHALLRSSVDILIAIAHFTLVFIAWREGGVPEGVDPAKMGNVLVPTNNVVTWIGGAWYFGELVTMFANPQRRALHDFLGGTVVVRSNEQKP